MEMSDFFWWNSYGYWLIMLFSVIVGIVEGACLFYLLLDCKKLKPVWWLVCVFNVFWCIVVARLGNLAVVYAVWAFHPSGSTDQVAELIDTVFPQGGIIGLAVVYALSREYNAVLARRREKCLCSETIVQL